MQTYKVELSVLQDSRCSNSVCRCSVLFLCFVHRILPPGCNRSFLKYHMIDLSCGQQLFFKIFICLFVFKLFGSFTTSSAIGATPPNSHLFTKQSTFSIPTQIYRANKPSLSQPSLLSYITELTIVTANSSLHCLEASFTATSTCAPYRHGVAQKELQFLRTILHTMF